MDRWLARIPVVTGAALGTFAGVVAVQLMRLRRIEFLPAHPGFYVNHVVPAPRGESNVRPIRLTVLGDSTTAGVGVARPEDSLPHLLAQRIAVAEGRAVHVVSYGWAGARVRDLVEIQLPRALEPLRATETQPFLSASDVVAIVIGSNDATHNTPPSRYRHHLRATLAGVLAAAPNARVTLAGIPRFRGALRGVEPLISLADLYARILRPIGRQEAARHGAAYADLAAEVPPRIVPGSGFLSSDRFHPSVVGYSLWADVIFESLGAGTDSEKLAARGFRIL